MKPIDTAGFEALFQRDKDPWNYEHSPFEAFKRKVLMRSCGQRLYARGFEPACANGATSKALARRCLRLVAVDSSPSVIEEARRKTSGLRISFAVRQLPLQTPRGPFDLIVASEILYYLPEREMRLLLSKLLHALAPGGRIVLLHHTVPFDDAAQPPHRAHDIAKRFVGRRLRRSSGIQHCRFEVVAFDKRSRPQRR